MDEDWQRSEQDSSEPNPSYNDNSKTWDDGLQLFLRRNEDRKDDRSDQFQ